MTAHIEGHGPPRPATYNWLGCRCDDCKWAIYRYNKRLALDHIRTGSRRMPALGVRRRIEALGAIGYSFEAIASNMPETYNRMHVRRLLLHREWVSRKTFADVDSVFDRLAMTEPPRTNQSERSSYSKTINRAKRNGYAPPLAWLDIDDPDEIPDRITTSVPRRDSILDEAVVFRILDGDFTVRATRDEKAAAIRRYVAAGGTLRGFERESGWGRLHRILEGSVAA